MSDGEEVYSSEDEIEILAPDHVSRHCRVLRRPPPGLLHV